MNNGILLLDKPIGYSSNQALQKVKKKLSLKKVGHFGTLDPFADGLLILGIGKGTKLSNIFLNEDKTYVAEIFLGEEKDTDDLEGDTIFKSSEIVSYEHVISVLKDFEGRIEQVPPKYSALKHNGKPLYDYAREGNPITKPARQVIIHELKVIEFKFPKLKLEITCSKGTYVRAIARDLGRKLGIGGHLQSLRRLKQGSFDISDSKSIDYLSEKNIISIEDCTKIFDEISISDNEYADLKNYGKTRSKIKKSGYFRGYNNENFVGILSFSKDHLVKEILV